jgi:hypothetical protein
MVPPRVAPVEEMLVAGVVVVTEVPTAETAVLPAELEQLLLSVTTTEYVLLPVVVGVAVAVTAVLAASPFPPLAEDQA